MRRFALKELDFHTYTADGIQYCNGWCCISWRTDPPRVAIYQSIEDVRVIHLDNVVEWADPQIGEYDKGHDGLKIALDELPTFLKQRRTNEGLTKYDIAGQAGLSTAAVSHYENNAREISFVTLAELATALGVKVSLLIEDF